MLNAAGAANDTAEGADMTVRIACLAALAAVACASAIALATEVPSILPSGLHLTPPAGAIAKTGTFPQGLALSPSGTRLAVVESGAGPAGLRVFDVPGLQNAREIPLTGAFGAPVWLDGTHVLVAGANDDAVEIVDIDAGKVSRRIALAKGSWPAAVALSPDRATLAVAYDVTGKAVTVDLASGNVVTTFTPGEHPSAIAFSSDGKAIFVASRTASAVTEYAATGRFLARTTVSKHPAALALSSDSARLFVAGSDGDAIDAIDLKDFTVGGVLSLDGSAYAKSPAAGLMPNSLAVAGNTLYATLAGTNAVIATEYRDGGWAKPRAAATGWYPSGVAVASDGTLYVSDAKGEGTIPNPEFKPNAKDDTGYVAAQRYGSVRQIAGATLTADGAYSTTPGANASAAWKPPADSATVIRPNGPIRHVILVIKENRSFDQVLGDVAGANGDASLTWFGYRVTPNQHAIAHRFGTFDNLLASGEVSANGHNWTDGAIANDYVERTWPSSYGDRRDVGDAQDGTGAPVARNGYLWDAAARAHITYRVYGEDIDVEAKPGSIPVTTHPGLVGHFDPRYVSWDLDYSDLGRLKEWRREFSAFVAGQNLPALEIVWLPNDHTSGSRPGKPSPRAYVAQNDLAFGGLVDTVSHSPYWKSTAIFAIEDDAQNGPDHYSDQRTTAYVASPYAAGGIRHEPYCTISVDATVERILNLKPLSIYDSIERPMYEAFVTRANLAPFNALPAATDLKATNAKTAYGAGASARMNFSQPDAVDPAVLSDILAHDAAAAAAAQRR